MIFDDYWWKFGGLIAIRHFFLDFRHGEIAEKIAIIAIDFLAIFAMVTKMANIFSLWWRK